jgi:hypothetical protein
MLKYGNITWRFYYTVQLQVQRFLMMLLPSLPFVAMLEFGGAFYATRLCAVERLW